MNYVNHLYESICQAMHDAVDLACKHFPSTKMRKNAWWSKTCTLARNRNQLFYKIWVSMGRPQEGQTYNCYKEARKAYKKTCRQAVNKRTHNRFGMINKLAKEHKAGRMWNIIRKTKNVTNTTTAITINKFEDYFREKFDAPKETTPVMEESKTKVQEKIRACSNVLYTDYTITEYQVRKYIKRLKNGVAAGIDRISSEHLKYGINTALPALLSQLLTVCTQHGCVPKNFTIGLLTPILKKANIDPTVAKHYRPITISVIISKLFEHHILDMCSDYDFSTSQYGFIPNRGSDKATVLAHDVGVFANSCGSTVFYCSLDAEGAFDFLPHPVLLNKAMEVYTRCLLEMFL